MFGLKEVLGRRDTDAAIAHTEKFFNELADKSPGKLYDLETGKLLPDSIAHDSVVRALKPPNQISAERITGLRHLRRKLIAHEVEMERNLKKPDFEIGADAKAQIEELLMRIKNHPARGADLRKLGTSIAGYSKLRAFNDLWHEANSISALWLRENRWAAAPIVATILILKLTVGLWILHQFDKLFGTRSAKGDPFMQDPAKWRTPPSSHHKHHHGQANEDPRNFGNTQLGVLNTPYPPAGNVGQNPAVQNGYSPAATGAGLVTSPALGSLNYA